MESDKFGAGAGWSLNYLPVLAGKGYAVLRPNYRGSTGYGNAFFATSSAATSTTWRPTCWRGVDALDRSRASPIPIGSSLMGWSAGGTWSTS